MAFKTVPMPGIWRSGIQKIKTAMLMRNVDVPTLQPAARDTPCANTVQGLTPIPAAIKSASPSPNMTSPKHRTTTDNKGGRMVSGYGALQNNFGTALTEKKSEARMNELS